MRWKIERQPKHGDVTWRKHFAWTPVTVDGSTYKVWLEFYRVQYRYSQSNLYSGWTKIENSEQTGY